jgi:Flp pilus assembly protein TadD
MGRIDKTVFLSYRRTNAPWALAIFQSLYNEGYDAFLDFNGIASGDFETLILENIKARAHFIILLTPSALEPCNLPGDWLRREIETALETRRNIVPLMLEGFDFGAPGIGRQLTGKLAELKAYNALRVPVEYFVEAMGRLRDRYLNVPLDAVLHPASFSAQQAAEEQQAAAVNAPAVQDKELTAGEWFERGVSATDLDEQLRCYSEAIRLQPGYAAAFSNRGAIRYLKNDLEGALRDYNEAIRLKPDDPFAFNNRGVACADKGDLEGAIQDYNEAIRLDPNDAAAFSNRGNARQRKGDLEGALRDYDEAIWHKPDAADVFFYRGNARSAQGDMEGAQRDYDEAARINPKFKK